MKNFAFYTPCLIDEKHDNFSNYIMINSYLNDPDNFNILEIAKTNRRKFK